MPMTRNYTTLLLYILLSILLLVLPLSNVAYAQSETIPGPGPIDELIENIEEAIDKVQEQIREAFDDFCESLSKGSPGERIICPLIIRDRVDR